MKFASYRAKIILLTIIPLVIAIIIIAMTTIQQTQELGDSQVRVFEAGILQSKKNEMKNYMDLAYTAIKEIYENAKKNDLKAQATVLNLLRSMEFGRDGYFYVYGYDGVNIAHSRKPDLEGKNLFKLQDDNGKYVIQELIVKAKTGGGYTRYLWDKPSGGKSVEKIGYSIGLDKWSWMIGTGLYLDDIQKGIEKINAKISKTTSNALVLAFLVASGMILVVGLLSIAFNISESKLADTKMRKLTQKTISFQEEERKRVSRELHDGINQLLVSVRYQLDDIYIKIGKQRSEEILQLVGKADNALSLCIREIRRISKDLRPTLLDDLGLFPALESFATDFYDRTTIRVKIKSNMIKERLPAVIETAVYRVSQEALTNIEKHAHFASLVTIVFELSSQVLLMTINNNGRGFNSRRALDIENPARGMGLRNMQDRIELLDGNISIRSHPAKGTTVTVKLPLISSEQGFHEA